MDLIAEVSVKLYKNPFACSVTVVSTAWEKVAADII